MTHPHDSDDNSDCGVILEYHPAPDEEPEPPMTPVDIADAIGWLTWYATQIGHKLTECGVHPNLVQSTEYQIHQLWSNALRTVKHA